MQKEHIQDQSCLLYSLWHSCLNAMGLAAWLRQAGFDPPYITSHIKYLHTPGSGVFHNILIIEKINSIAKEQY